MCIRTASGVRDVLNDARADEIRDQDVVPRFKAGDMAGGIAGTHTYPWLFWIRLFERGDQS